ncbi:MAG TPA: hypothetical protein VKU82_00585 [Planctomycetaceae bacterium]|nr:hypothetical protein [Planctomycetaceae bacterium]
MLFGPQVVRRALESLFHPQARRPVREKWHLWFQLSLIASPSGTIEF